MSTTTQTPRRVTTTASSGRPKRPRRYARLPYIRLNGAGMVALVAAALSIIGILYLVQTAHVASLGYQLSALQKQRDDLAVQTAGIQSQVAQYESLNQIQGIATERLGMVPMQHYIFLNVPEQPVAVNPPAATTQPQPKESLWHRFVRQITGTGRADAPEKGPPALPIATESSKSKSTK